MTRTPAPALSPAEAAIVARFDAAPTPPEVQVETLRRVLLDHHPLVRSETGPFSGCRCGQVKLGQDVIAHVAAAVLAALPPSPAEEAVKRVEALAESWRYKGEFGWGAWQEGQGPDLEGSVLDQAAADLRAALASPAPAPQGGGQR